MNLHAVILIGGQSRRMGTDKAVLAVDGSALTERLSKRCEAAGLEVSLSGHDRPGLPAELPRIVDQQPGHGPLGGLLSALAFLEQNVLLLACDLPDIDIPFLRWLADKNSDDKEHALGTILHGPRGPEPCCSIYRPACLPLLAEKLANKQRSLYRLAAEPGFGRLDCPDTFHHCLTNLNDPDDLDRWQQTRTS